MAGYGSAIGMGTRGGFASVGGGGGSQNSLRTPNSATPGSMYSGKVRRGTSSWGTHHYLWLLVFIELAVLVALRVIVFKPYHAG